LRQCREEAWLVTVGVVKRKPPKWKHAATQAIFYFKVNRRRDADNLAAMLKPYWDGLADAGIIKNDSGFTHMPVIVKIDKKNPRVELHVAPEA
jgi:Holliday junction resolvase RusA-like endonuclease